MSKVLWCDPGKHAFKAGSPGSLHLDGSTVGDNGQDENQTMDACAQHNPLRAQPANIVKELEAEFPVNGGIQD